MLPMEMFSQSMAHHEIQMIPIPVRQVLPQISHPIMQPHSVNLCYVEEPNPNFHGRYFSYVSDLEYHAKPIAYENGTVLCPMAEGGFITSSGIRYQLYQMKWHSNPEFIVPRPREISKAEKDITKDEGIDSTPQQQPESLRRPEEHTEKKEYTGLRTILQQTPGLGSKSDKSGTKVRGGGDSGIVTHDNSSSNASVIGPEDAAFNQVRNNEVGLWTKSMDENFWRKERKSPPEHARCKKMVLQMECYMSDEYLEKDKYLLGQLRNRSGGFVKLRFISSFKKMKSLVGSNWVNLRFAIVRMSASLVISADGTSLRRKTPLPEHLLRPIEITSVIVIRLPDEYNSINKLTALFRKFGELESVRILKSDKSVPSDIRNYATQIPDLGTTLCAVVVYENPTSALTAVRVLKHKARKCLPTTEANEGENENEKESEKDEESEKDKKRRIEEKLMLKEIQETMPDLEEMRLALLGPRVRRTLYREDRKKQADGASLEEADDVDDGCNKITAL